MNIAKRPVTPAFFFALWLVFTCFGSSAAEKTQTTNAAATGQKEYDLVQKRFYVYEDLLNAASWTLCHCADEQELKAVEKTLNLLSAFDETNGFTKLIEAGGVQTLKANVASFLEN